MRDLSNFELIGIDIELHDDNSGVVSLFENHYFENGRKIIEYYTLDECGNKRFFQATKDPEHLTDEERYRILDYCLSSFDEDEIVNYHDLFIQREFIKEI